MSNIDDRAVVCPTCNASPGDPCRTVKGRHPGTRSPYPHADRVRPLYEVWSDGYGDGGRDTLAAVLEYVVELLPPHVPGVGPIDTLTTLLRARGERGLP